MSEEKELKVGDRIYCISTFDKTVKSIHVVNRVTKTQAFLDNNQKFKRFYGSGLESIPYESGLKHYSYKIETEELKEKVNLQKLIYKIKEQCKTIKMNLDSKYVLQQLNLKKLENISRILEKDIIEPFIKGNELEIEKV